MAHLSPQMGLEDPAGSAYPSWSCLDHQKNKFAFGVLEGVASAVMA